MSPFESHKPVFQLSRSAVVRLEQNTRQVEWVPTWRPRWGDLRRCPEKALEDAEQGRWQAFHSKRGARLMAYLLLDLEPVTKTPEYLNQLSVVLERLKTKSMESALLMATMAHWSEPHRPRLQRLVKEHVAEKVNPMGVQSLRPISLTIVGSPISVNGSEDCRCTNGQNKSNPWASHRARRAGIFL